MPPPTSQTGLNKTNTSATASTKTKYSHADNWRKGIKRDPNLFPIIKRDEDWKDFFDNMVLEAKLQLTYDVLDQHTFQQMMKILIYFY